MAKSFNLDNLVNTGDSKEALNQEEQGASTPRAADKARTATRSKSSSKPKSDPAPAPQLGPSKRLSLTLDAETYRALRLHALETDRTHQDILAEAARAYLRKHASK